MSRWVVWCSAAVLLCAIHSASAADNGDGTYTNPPLYADYPDPDIIRVDDDFYMVSTTFVNSPGLALLRSKDLVNWTTIGNIVDKLSGDPRYDMEGGTLYRNGVFAPSIRYHNGTFYVAVQPNGTGQGMQVYHTQDPEGEWQLQQLDEGAFDPGLFFDDDGTPYVVYSGGWHPEIYLRELTPTLDSFVGPPEEIHNYPGLEGTHLIKRGDTYYMFHSRPGQLAMYVSRSTDLFGGWETVRSIDDASGSGHQGGVVDLPNGEWYGFAMLDSGAIGRVTNISPITWEDDWPVWGDDDLIPDEADKPIQGLPIVMRPRSTDFEESSLPHEWRWNHNPDDARWSLTEREGYLRLRPTVAPDFWNAQNTLTHKGFGPSSQAVVEMDISSLRSGDTAGLGMLGKGLALLAVERDAGGQARITLNTGEATATSGPVSEAASASLGAVDTVYLTLRMDFEQGAGQTAYSVDGLNWTSIGESFPLLWDWATGTFQGEQYALFNYNAEPSDGYVDINRVSFVQRGDVDRDGDLDEDDYLQFRRFHLQPLSGDSPLETFAFGDIDGDLDNDYQDFRRFKDAYIAAHGVHSMNALVARVGPVPEANTFALSIVWAGAVLLRARAH